MKKLFKFFAKQPTLALLFSFGIIVLGASSLMNINRNMFPNVDFGEMVITTTYPGASAEDVEINITNKLEKEIMGVSGVKQMTSFSQESISLINLNIEPDVKDQEKVKKNIKQAIDRVTDFPSTVEDRPVVTEINSNIFPIIEVGLLSDTLSYDELREISRQFNKKLKKINGVSRTEAFGFNEKEVKINIDPVLLKKNELSLNDVFLSLKNRNIRSTAGKITINNSEKIITTLSQFEKPEDVKDVIIRSNYSGNTVKISDIATVEIGFEEPDYINRMNGKPAISYRVFKSESGDIVKTVNKINELITEEKKLLEGIDISFATADDQSYYVKNRFDVVVSNGVLGLIFIIVVLTFFFNLNTSFWIAMGIPISVFGVIWLLPNFGSTLNVISLMAIIIVMGIIVDDAIIVAENIAQKREEGLSPIDAAITGVDEVFKPVITTILTTFIAFAPMYFMSGVMGKFIWVIPLVITLALIVSLIECLIALPAHLIPGLDKIKVKQENKPSGWFNTIQKYFDGMLRKCIRNRLITLFGFIIFLIFSIWYASNKMSFVLFPSKISNEFMIFVDLPKGTNIIDTEKKLSKIENILLELPKQELKAFRTRIGMSGDEYYQTPQSNKSMVLINLTPFSDRKRDAYEIVEELRKKTNALTGFESIKYNVSSGGPPVGKAINIRIVGSNDKIRNQLTADVINYMKTIPEIYDIKRNDDNNKEEIETIIDYNKISRLGLSVLDVTNTLRMAVDGLTATTVRYDEDDTDFRIQIKKDKYKNTNFFDAIYIANPQKRLIPLKEVVSLKEGQSQSVFYHYDGEKAVSITSDLDKEKLSPKNATNMIINNFDLSKYPGMSFIVGGESEETQESINDLLRTLILALLGIYFLLVILFNSYTQPFLIIFILPFSILSVVIILGIHNQPIAFISGIGLIGLMGVVVNDALVLLYRINKLIATKPEVPILDNIIEGTKSRLRPIVLTSLTTIAGLLPLAYGIGGADPFIAPMGLVLGYGLFFATPIIVILLPCLYSIYHDFKKINLVNILFFKKRNDDTIITNISND